MDEELTVLKKIKNDLGQPLDDDSFDGEILMHIGGAFDTLRQVGVGKAISNLSESTIWEDFIPSNITTRLDLTGMIKRYVYCYVRLIFDPPAPSTATIMKESIDEMLWRLQNEYDVVEIKGT